MKDTEGITALDKFKRRLVRDIARRLHQEKQSEHEMFEQLGNEYGCDCKLLWDHMKSLTLKKLKRLLAADDRTDYITKIARMTATDWLTFDLVLVHEKLDVIGEDMIAAGKAEPTVHTLLFDLVGKYNIEGLVEQDRAEPIHLIEAWFALTKEYNTGGRECSPMLLQRRWYQLKESTRIRMYAFWKNYRGNPKLYEKAVAMKPTQLQISIADKYPIVVTDTFQQWEELIKNKKVLLASAFEIKRVKELNNSNSDAEPDLIMIEPNLETIEVDGCSESEEDNEETINSDTESTVKEEVEIKMEPNDLIDIEESELINELSNVKIPIENDTNPNQEEKEFAKSVEEADILLPKITSVMGSVMLPESNIENTPIEENIPTITEKVETPCEDDDDVQIIDPVTEDSITIDEISTTDNVNQTDVENIVKTHEIDSSIPVENLPDGLQLVDDGIELIEPDYEEELKPLEKEDERNYESTEENDTTCKIDPKLILFPITYTRKIDDMDVFKNASFQIVKGHDIIERALVESKPLFHKAAEKNQIDEEKSDGDATPIPRLKFSNWRLQKPKNRSYNPIQLCKNPDFNTRLKKLNVGFFSSERNRLLFNACKPLTIDLHKGFEDSLVDNTIYLETIDSPIVKKEKNMELCENTASVIPSAMAVQSLLDNTKLKVQELLQTKEEKPEEQVPEQVKPEEEKIEEIIPTNSVVAERNKTVKLPNIEQIRHQNLLVAEVSPMLLQNNEHGNKPPVQLVNASDPAPQTISPDSDEVNNKSSLLKDHDPDSRFVNVVHNNKTKRFLPKKIIIPKIRPTNILPAWTKPTSRVAVTDESLITKDTLHKMICLLSGVEVPSLKAKKSLAKKARRANDKQMANTEQKKEIRQDSTPVKNTVAVENDKSDLSKDTNKSQEISTKVSRRKSVRTVSSKSGYCCWARYRLQIEKPEQKLRHLCPKPFCRCCCRKLLVNKMLYEQRTTEGIFKFSNIDIRDEPIEDQDISSNTLQESNDHNNMENSGLTLSTTQIEAPSIDSQSSNYTPLTAASLQTVMLANEAVQGANVITLSDDESQKESRLGIPLVKTRVISGGTWARYMNTEEKKSLNVELSNLPSSTVYKQPTNAEPVIVIDEDEPNEPHEKIATTEQILPKGVNIVLLPDKRVSIAIDPDVQVDQEELAKVPEILLSVQKYFAEQNDINGVVNSNIISNDNTLQDESNIIQIVDANEFTDQVMETDVQHDSDTTDVALNVTVPHIENVENDNANYLSAEDSQQSNTIPIILKSNEQLFESTHSYIGENVIQTETENLKQTETENLIQTETERYLPNGTQNITEIESDTTGRNANKTTILSDLMAMSGISQEDSNVPIEEPLAVPTPTPSTSSRIFNYKMFNPADQSTGQTVIRKEKRFKKVIVSIRKKQDQNVPIPSDSVIDLTEDGDNSANVEKCDDQENDRQINNPPENIIRNRALVESIVKRLKHSTSEGKIIPVKMYKPQPIILKKSITPFKIVKSNDDGNYAEDIEFKQTYKIVGTKRAYSKKRQKPLILDQNDAGSDGVKSSENDSSDDEPLAKKIRRIRDSSEQSVNTTDEKDEPTVALINNVVPIDTYNVPIEFSTEQVPENTVENNENGTEAKSVTSVSRTEV